MIRRMLLAALFVIAVVASSAVSADASGSIPRIIGNGGQLCVDAGVNEVGDTICIPLP